MKNILKWENQMNYNSVKTEDKTILKLENEKWNKTSSSEEGGTYHQKEEGKNFIIEMKFDKFGNKVSILETSNKVG